MSPKLTPRCCRGPYCTASSKLADFAASHCEGKHTLKDTIFLPQEKTRNQGAVQCNINAFNTSSVTPLQGPWPGALSAGRPFLGDLEQADSTPVSLNTCCIPGSQFWVFLPDFPCLVLISHPGKASLSDSVGANFCGLPSEQGKDRALQLTTSLLPFESLAWGSEDARSLLSVLPLFLFQSIKIWPCSLQRKASLKYKHV